MQSPTVTCDVGRVAIYMLFHRGGFYVLIMAMVELIGRQLLVMRLEVASLSALRGLKSGVLLEI